MLVAEQAGASGLRNLLLARLTGAKVQEDWRGYLDLIMIEFE